MGTCSNIRLVTPTSASPDGRPAGPRVRYRSRSNTRTIPPQINCANWTVTANSCDAMFVFAVLPGAPFITVNCHSGSSVESKVTIQNVLISPCTNMYTAGQWSETHPERFASQRRLLDQWPNTLFVPHIGIILCTFNSYRSGNSMHVNFCCRRF